MAVLSNLDSLKVFFYAAKYQSISRAAKELFLSQPSATRIIRALENELECQLFTRTSRGVVLTHEGQLFYQHLIPAMEAIEQAQAELMKMRRLENGFIHVGVNNLAAEYILKVVTDSFVAQYPGVTITMSRVDPARMETSLRNSWLDLVLYIDMGDYPELAGVPVRADAAGLTERVVGSFPDAFLVGPRYAYLAQRKQAASELAALPLIVPLEAHAASKYYLKLFRGTETASPIDITVDGAQSRLALARRNLGLTHFPAAFVREQLERRELYEVQTDLPMRNNTVYLYSATPTLPNAAAQRFVDMLFELDPSA